MEENIVLIDDLSIRDKIYTIRGVRVMLDFDLAEIYGYSTSAFNQQVKRNTDKFPEDFSFQLKRQVFCYHKMLQQTVAETGELSLGHSPRVVFTCS